MLKTADHPDGVERHVFDDMAEALRTDRAAFWTGFFKDFYGVGLLSQPASDEVLAWSSALAMQAGLKATLDCAEAFATTDFRSDLASFRVPTLVIHGTGDKTVPIAATARPAAAGIAHSRLIEYDGAPHGLLASHKQRLFDDVLAFIQGREIEVPPLSPLLLVHDDPNAPFVPGLSALSADGRIP
jgi:pimeloyl-ACP methyl ester carboxylesterase